MLRRLYFSITVFFNLLKWPTELKNEWKTYKCSNYTLMHFQGVRMGETSTNLANVNMHQGQKVRVEDGCNVANPCSSNVCPEHSRCVDNWSSHPWVCQPGKPPPPFLSSGCRAWNVFLFQNGGLTETWTSEPPLHCFPGYFGRDCVDVCLMNPCEHVSTCVRQPSSPPGYSCQCGNVYYGQYCQKKWVVNMSRTYTHIGHTYLTTRPALFVRHLLKTHLLWSLFL